MPFKKMSPCLNPRLGTEPSAGEKDSVSEVRLISSTLSLGPVGGVGSGVGVWVLLGRKMVLRPWPLNVPANAVSGPRPGVDDRDRPQGGAARHLVEPEVGLD